MKTALRVITTVQPGKKIEIAAPELVEGAQVEVTIMIDEAVRSTQRSAMETIDSLHGHRLFATPQDVDRHVREERDSWDR